MILKRIFVSVLRNRLAIVSLIIFVILWAWEYTSAQALFSSTVAVIFLVAYARQERLLDDTHHAKATGLGHLAEWLVYVALCSFAFWNVVWGLVPIMAPSLVTLVCLAVKPLVALLDRYHKKPHP